MNRLDFDDMRLPPQNLECERGVLGGILLESERYYQVAPWLRIQDFYRDSHQVMWQGIVDSFTCHGRVDSQLLMECLAARGTLDAAGGIDGIVEVLQSVPHAANVACHAGVVVEKARLRDMAEAANGLARDCYLNREPADDIIGRAMHLFTAIAERWSDSRLADSEEVIREAMDRIVMRRQQGRVGLSSGLAGLDALIDGFQPGQMIVIGARPRMGKSALAAHLVAQFSGQDSGRSLIFSLEMDRADIGERMLAARSGVSFSLLRSCESVDGVARELYGAAAELSALPFSIDDSPTHTIGKLELLARRERLRGPLATVVVDYAQLVAPDERGTSRQEQVADISRRLKGLSKTLQCPVIALAQLNRECEARADKRPMLSDLRESGALENDADVVLLLNRPECWNAADRPGVLELIVAKNRNGREGIVNLHFDGDRQSFDDPADPLDGDHIDDDKDFSY